MTSRDKQNQKLSVANRIEPAVNRYYAKVSRRYLAAGILLTVLFALFVFGAFAFGSDYITYENMRYLVRDLGTAADEGARTFDRIVYNGSQDTEFAWFRGGMAVCGNDFYRYYDKNGALIFSDTLSYSSPVLVPADKYLLVYDLGGTGYAVYNQLTRIVEKNTEERIIAADIAADGSLVLATRSHDTKFVVELTNAAFNRTMASYKDGYVLCTAISPDGEHFLVASAVAASTDFGCEIEINKRGETASIAKDVHHHSMPLMAAATDDGFVVLCDQAVYYYNSYGVMERSVPLSGMTLRSADICGGVVAVVGQVNALGSQNRVLVLDRDGTPLCDEELKTRVSGVRAGRDPNDALAYVMTPDSVIRIGPDGSAETMKPESGEIVDVIPLTTGAMLCQKTSAYQIFTATDPSEN